MVVTVYTVHMVMGSWVVEKRREGVKAPKAPDSQRIAEKRPFFEV